MTTPRELYNRTPVKVVYPFDEKEIINPYGDFIPEVFRGCYYNHLPELEERSYDGSYVQLQASRDVRVDYYKDHCYDGRRVWVLSSVWYCDQPVMILQNAGREGDDYVRRFITDIDLYEKMIDHIRSLYTLKKDLESQPDVVSIDEDIPNLTEFYGDTVEGQSKYW